MAVYMKAYKIKDEDSWNIYEERPPKGGPAFVLLR